MGDTSFPRLTARTRRFTLGEPRTFSPSPDGRRVLFLRSGHGTDPDTCLWQLDVDSGIEHVVADPAEVLADPGDLPPEEARRRERARESAAGIVGYATDADATVATFALGGQLFLTDLVGDGAMTGLETEPGVFDPRLGPDGHRVAYVAGPTLRLVGPGEPDMLLAGDTDPDVSWGSAEFVAAEEMGRSRGFWWSPDGATLAVARVDVSAVPTWHIGDPANPGRHPVAIRYPAAGTTNAEVGLHLIDLDGSGDSGVREVRWDQAAWPYLASVDWSTGHDPFLVVQSRDQRRLAVLDVDVATGATSVRWRHQDPHWVELVSGAPRWWGDDLACLVDRDGARRLVVGERALTPVDLQVRSVVGPLGDDLVVTASPDPTETHVYRVSPDGHVQQLTEEAGVHGAATAGGTTVIASTSMAWPGVRATVWRDGAQVAEIASHAARPPLTPNATFSVVGDRSLRTVVLVPNPSDRATDAATATDVGPLPVLLDPYGGPHALRVVRSSNAQVASQWLADQGFAVVVTDGRGTPARGPEWERAVWGDLARPVLDDQVDALHALAAKDERLDLGRVAIRGWSFGGYLAALAVLRRPDVFHAAIAGAPVTDWRLYDTHYTERYLGHPDDVPEHYATTNLLADAHLLRRPLLLIHGLADDNVVAAHTLQLSSALLAAGRPHQVLPLSGVTHMTPQEVVAENLLLLQLAFLRDALASPA